MGRRRTAEKLCVNEIKNTTNITQSSMNTTLAAEAIFDLNSNQCTWLYAPTSLYILHGNYKKGYTVT